LFRKALKIDPGLPQPHVGLARVSAYLYTLGLDESSARLETALAEARRAVDLDPRGPAARSTLAVVLAVADRLTPALEEARKAIDLDPQSADGHLASCRILRLKEDLDGALAACGRAAEIEPESPGVLTALADALRESGRYAEAMELYGQAVDLDHEAIVPQLGAAAALQKAHRTGAAQKAYNLLLGGWDYAQNRVRLGAAALLIALEDHESALEMYAGIGIPEGGSLPTLLALYGKAYCLLRLERAAEAEYFLSGLIDRVPVDYDGPARGRDILFMAYEDLAQFFETRGRSRKSEETLRAALGRPLAPARLARSLASRLQEKGETGEAAEVLERAILGSDPLDDPIDVAEAVLDLARLRTKGGSRRVQGGSETARALRLSAERLESCHIGAVHYALARAQALSSWLAEAVLSLERARDGGYLPIDRMDQEPDFGPIRQDPAFRNLVQR
jgi:tetratricopeptide (TPR) repeat protein